MIISTAKRSRGVFRGPSNPIPSLSHFMFFVLGQFLKEGVLSKSLRNLWTLLFPPRHFLYDFPGFPRNPQVTLPKRDDKERLERSVFLPKNNFPGIPRNSGLRRRQQDAVKNVQVEANQWFHSTHNMTLLSKWKCDKQVRIWCVFRVHFSSSLIRIWTKTGNLDLGPKSCCADFQILWKCRNQRKCWHCSMFLGCWHTIIFSLSQN